MQKSSRFPLRFSISGQLFFFSILALVAMLSLVLFDSVTFSHLTTQRADMYFEVYMKQLTNQIESVLQQTENHAKTLTASKNIQAFMSAETDYERFSSVSPAVDSIDTVIYSFPLLQDIQVLRHDGVAVSSSSSYTSTWSKQMFNRIAAQYNLGSTPLRTDFYTEMYTDEDQVSYAYIRPIYSTKTNTLSNENIGVLIFLCRIDRFVELIDDMHSVLSATFMFSAGGHQTFSAPESAELSELGAYVASLSFEDQKGVSFRYDNKNYLSGCEEIANTDWRIYYWIDVDALTADMTQMRHYALMGAVFFGGVLLMLCVSLYLQITRPIRAIALNLATLQLPQDRLRPMPTNKNELLVIHGSINTMLDHMQEAMEESQRVTEKLYQAEMETRKAELVYYQKQINPHFLYNSLECIRSMAIHGAIQPIEGFTQSLASIFRYAVSGSRMVPFRQELQCVQDYFSVMDTRFPGRYRLSMDIGIDPDTLTMKMILQPLLENCLTHAYDARHTRIHIALKAWYAEGCVHIRIADNGRGIDPDVFEEITQKLAQVDRAEETFRYFGLLNVHRRLVLSYGDGYGLRLRSRFGHYVSVELVFPA